jgi:hypothetical protein
MLPAEYVLDSIRTGRILFSSPECFSDSTDAMPDMERMLFMSSGDRDALVSRLCSLIIEPENDARLNPFVAAYVCHWKAKLTEGECAEDEIRATIAAEVNQSALKERHQANSPQEIMSDFRRRLRVLCLTEELGNERLWRQYGGSSAAAIRFTDTGNASVVAGARQVVYSRDWESTYTLDQWMAYALGEDDLPRIDREECTRRFLCRKSMVYRYEREWRTITSESKMGHRQDIVHLDGKPERWLVPIDRDQITAVYVGASVSGDIVSQLRKIRRRDHRHLRLYQQIREEDYLNFRRLV